MRSKVSGTRQARKAGDLPSFSIIVPTYQRRALICETLHGLEKLQYPKPVEIIVVIDGSTDGTSAALPKLDPPLQLHVIEQANEGAGAARNRGAALATGDILLFLDDDMVCEPDVLMEHARSYAAGADAVVGDFTEAGASVGLLSQIIEKRSAAGAPEALLTPFDIFGGHISMRREVFEDLGGFDESFAGNGDWGDFDVGQRLLERFKVVHNPRALSHHRGVLRPMQYVRRARSCAHATLRFAAKHPELGSELAEWTGSSRISRRLRLLCHVPLVPRIGSDIAGWVAELGSRTPFRKSQPVMYLRRVGYTLAYWSTILRNAPTGEQSSKA